jgi:beta-lactamase regulating signal transducer with metallopeptidase domain
MKLNWPIHKYILLIVGIAPLLIVSSIFDYMNLTPIEGTLTSTLSTTLSALGTTFTTVTITRTELTTKMTRSITFRDPSTFYIWILLAFTGIFCVIAYYIWRVVAKKLKMRQKSS